MQQVVGYQNIYQFFDSNQPKGYKNFYHNYFANPVRVGAFAVKLNFDQARTLHGKPDEFYYKYSLNKFENERRLDLKTSEEERLVNNLEVLKINSDLKPMLDYILMNKQDYLFQPRNPPQLPRSSNTAFRSFTPIRPIRPIRRRKRKILNSDFVSFRSTMAILL